ncbi:hypothetical protein DIZ81_10845 [Legionella taurinensis]|uniref:Uncharacterized protein n=1 Tax=Legionella taurinensis TaxID=70611 RepID=A0A3A5LEY3_9GAMM|nr:hypothetical protein DB744_10855 [Legionella taurinensis]PUT39562.1 hypothetical protein DB746_13510 [Legionella taurinensis]PUT43564.1 hypothetical protein DB743_10245 [Legionella taurinensis]PUT45218.1 hypothetical protein DB745_13450 [Legionella taurinensis]RJT46905.1 hypothetical protein D6J04_07700 [Legionella taurinensis]
MDARLRGQGVHALREGRQRLAKGARSLGVEMLSWLKGVGILQLTKKRIICPIIFLGATILMG